MASIINATTTAGVSVQGDNSGSLQLATNNGTTALTIDTSQNVGIGTTSPATKLTVASEGRGRFYRADNTRYGDIYTDNNAFKIESSTDPIIINAATGQGIRFQDAGTERMRIDSSGGLILVGSTAQKATGTTWSNPSDIRLKDNIQDYTKGLSELMQVNVKTWEYNGKGDTVKGTKGLGVVADEIMAVLPDTVENYEVKLNADDEESTAIKKFDATEITWLMLKAIQELKAELDATKAEVQALKGVA